MFLAFFCLILEILRKVIKFLRRHAQNGGTFFRISVTAANAAPWTRARTPGPAAAAPAGAAPGEAASTTSSGPMDAFWQTLV